MEEGEKLDFSFIIFHSERSEAMDKYAKLKELMRGICGDGGKGQAVLFQAEVVIVEGDCCTVDAGGLELSDVRLKSVVDGKTDGVMLLVPEVGSKVLVGSLTGDYRDLAVLSIERFDRYVLGGDGFGGMVKATELVKRLNALEKEVNNLRTAISGWVPVAQDGGAALLGALSNWLAGNLQETRQEDIENAKILHG